MIRINLILSMFLGLAYIVLADDDEFYCKVKIDNWQVCRRCNETNRDCDGTSDRLTDKCRCEDIKLTEETSYNLTGGWETCATEGWCYVRYQEPSGTGACSDQGNTWYDGSDDFSPDSKNTRGTKSDIWLYNPEGGWEGLSKSKEACKSKQIYNTGNEPVLEGKKIIGDRLQIILENGTLAGEFTIYVENSDDCKGECDNRRGLCGAWSYNKEDGQCFLHTIDTCCGQFGKRMDDNNFTSGYSCGVCWSTKDGTECPCSVKERQAERPTIPQAGAYHPLHNGPTGEGRVDCTPQNIDTCACVYRIVGRRKKCKCLKPQCKDKHRNPTGICEDPRRCRKGKLPAESCGRVSDNSCKKNYF